MSFAPETTRHTIVLCVSAQQKGFALQELLRKAGHNLVIALSVYDAANIISQELPHLILTEARLPDGDAFQIFDQMAKSELLKKIPVVALIQGATEEISKKFTDKGFEAVIGGQTEPKSVLAQVQKTITERFQVSPFFIPSKEIKEEPKLDLLARAKILGLYGQLVISRSTIELATKSNIKHLFEALEASTVEFDKSVNLRSSSDVFNFFPRKSVYGGHNKLETLPDLKALYKKAAPSRPRTIAIMGGNFSNLAKTLEERETKLVCVPAIAELVAEIKKGTEIGCIFLPGGLTRELWQIWNKLIALLPTEKRPSLLLGVNELPTRKIPNVIYMKMPSGLETMLSYFEIALTQTEVLEKIIGRESGESSTGVDVKFALSGLLEGIDETGGIIKTDFPILEGCKLGFKNKFLQTLLEGDEFVTVTSCAPSPDEPDTFHSRFSMTKAGTSKLKNWEKILKKL